jgi:hypothetical protein
VDGVQRDRVEDPTHVVGSLAVIAGIAGSVAVLRPRAARAAGAVAS